ncbi:MAG: ParB/RepB/Spo0J family partition protein [Poseidonibacter sp.]|uniref:ParB/RepB/Spo0J family partition protein n=1 Tax=Poseidonibacter sp. TaxID=2321188 RepID=UPI00359F1102
MNYKDMNSDDLINRIDILTDKQNKSSAEKIELKKLTKEFDTRTSPVVASGVFIPEEIENKNRVEYIDIDKIIDNDFKDRTGIDESKIKLLAESIEEHGLLQPIVVKKNDDESYTKIIGKRRILAHNLLKKKKIKAIIYQGDNSNYKIRLNILHENHLREDLNMYDKVKSVLFLLKESLSLENINDVKTLCIKIKNINKIKNVDDSLLENKTKIEKVLKDSMIFSTNSTFVNSFPVLDMDDFVIDALTQNKINFATAKTINSYKNIKFKNNLTLKDILNDVIINEYSFRECKKYIEQLIKKDDSREKNTVNDSIKFLLKNINKLDINKQKSFEKELNNLKEKYFQ